MNWKLDLVHNYNVWINLNLEENESNSGSQSPKQCSKYGTQIKSQVGQLKKKNKNSNNFHKNSNSKIESMKYLLDESVILKI